MRTRMLAALLLGAIALAAHAAPGHIIRPTELKAKPFSDAATLATLAAQAKVDVIVRDGGWYRVKSGGKEGWVQMTALRLGDGHAKPGDTGVGSALSFLQTGRADSSNVTVATGIRGLDSTSMKSAVPNYGAVDGMNRFAVTPEQARKFAAEAKLKSHKIAYVPAAGAAKAPKKQPANPLPEGY